VGGVGIQSSGGGWDPIKGGGFVIQSSGKGWDAIKWGGLGFNQVGRVGIQSSGEGWDSINRYNPVTCLCSKPGFGCPI
jgi:hypothetical protein